MLILIADNDTKLVSNTIPHIVLRQIHYNFLIFRNVMNGWFSKLRNVYVPSPHRNATPQHKSTFDSKHARPSLFGICHFAIHFRLINFKSTIKYAGWRRRNMILHYGNWIHKEIKTTGMATIDWLVW